MGNPNRLMSLWTCGHCTVHLGDLKLREIVVEHLKSVYVISFTLIPVPRFIYLFIRHGIDSPREPEDLFFFSRTHPRDIFEASYPVKLSEEYRWFDPNSSVFCLECASSKSFESCRQLSLIDVKRHLLVK